MSPSPHQPAVVSAQMRLDLEAACRTLAALLADRRRTPAGGAERLLRALVRVGLDERALLPAAGMALELDRPDHDHEGDST
jgi:hypothetical protein